MTDYADLQALADGVLDDSTWIEPGDELVLPDNVTAIGRSDGSVDFHKPANGGKYSQEFRQHVFRIWAFEGTRSPTKTARIVQERDGITVTTQSIRNWSAAESWGDVAETIHQTFVVSSRSQTDALLNKYAVKAVEWAGRIFDDPHVSDNVKAKIALGLWDRTGHVPMFNTTSQINVITNVGRDDLAGKSDAELQALAGGYMGDAVGQELPPFEVDYREVKLAGHHRSATIDGQKIQRPDHATDTRPPRPR